MTTSNRKCRELVNEKVSFNANNLFAQNVQGLYVVYSYGVHFPMYVYDRVKSQWYANSDKYSMTTSKHQSQARPNAENMVKLSTNELREIINTTGVK